MIRHTNWQKVVSVKMWSVAVGYVSTCFVTAFEFNYTHASVGQKRSDSFLFRIIMVFPQICIQKTVMILSSFSSLAIPTANVISDGELLWHGQSVECMCVCRVADDTRGYHNHFINFQEIRFETFGFINTAINCCIVSNFQIYLHSIVLYFFRFFKIFYDEQAHNIPDQPCC